MRKPRWCQSDMELAKAKYEDAQRTYDRIKDGPNPADVAAAQARAAQATLDMARLTSPFADGHRRASAGRRPSDSWHRRLPRG